MSIQPPKRFFLFLQAALILTFVMGADVTRAATPATDPVTIVAFGDSTTAVRGETMIYAAILPEELRHIRVINAGVPGNTTEMARARFEKDVLSHQPQVAIIQFGINDSMVDVWKTPPATQSRVPLERYEANLRYFVHELKSRNTRVLLMTPNPLRWAPKLKELYGRPPYQPDDPDGLNIRLATYCEVVRRVAHEEGAELIDVQQAFFDQAQKQSISVDKLLLDGMHPNDQGHRIVADLLIERLLALAKEAGLPITAAPRPEILTAIPASEKMKFNSYPVVAALPDGRLFLAWTTDGGKSDSQRIVGAFSSDGGRHWDKPETVIDTPLADGDPAVILAPDEIQVYSTTREGSEIVTSESWKSTRKYNGTTWSPPVKMPAHHKYEVGKNHIGLTLSDGTLLMPYSWDVFLEDTKPVAGEGSMKLKSGVLRSHDGGETWAPGGDMFVEVPQKMSARATGGVCEPAMVLLPHDEIFALLRTSDSHHYQSRSHDGGQTWDTPSPSPLAGHNSPSALWRLRDSGDVLVVWNNSPLHRWPLAAALSKDGCKTWSKPRTLVNTPGYQAAYPSATQAADGTLIAVWFQILPNNTREIRLARFTREWLEAD
jgi:lysophospholipase L1-like esterase